MEVLELCWLPCSVAPPTFDELTSAVSATAPPLLWVAISVPDLFVVLARVPEPPAGLDAATAVEVPEPPDPNDVFVADPPDASCVAGGSAGLEQA